MTTVALETLQSVIERTLLRAGFSAEDAIACDRVHGESTRDGVSSHGLDRIPGLVNYLERGWVDSHGAFEQVQTLGRWKSMAAIWGWACAMPCWPLTGLLLWPGASTLTRRHANDDIVVNDEIWNAVQCLAGDRKAL